MEFHLYDEHKEMSLYDFCRICLVPFEGKTEEPHHDDVEGFIDTITVGETRKVSDARITSIHFPVLCYFALFATVETLVSLILLFCYKVYIVITLLVWAALLLNG